MWQRSPIPWVYRYRLRNHLRDSIWIVPVVAILLALITIRVFDAVEKSLGTQSPMNPETARVVLGAMASAMFTFVVFVSSTLLLTLQLASAQLTPRIVGFLFRDRVVKWALGAFVFAFAFILAALIRVGDSVPPLTARLAAYVSIVSLAAFLYLIDHLGKLLRANGALRSVGALGAHIVESVYPRFEEGYRPTPAPDVPVGMEPTQTFCSRRSGAVLAFDGAGLAKLARRYDCVIEVVPHVGDVVASGDPIFQIFRGTRTLPVTELLHSIAIGPERTFEQDPGLAFRIIVDIAERALSPAINDPSTAVVALDQLHHLLRNIGRRYLDEGVLQDSSGKCRLIFHTADWTDFVNLAVTEIRLYGGESIQIARRLRALLEDLIRTLPEKRAAPLRNELTLLRRSAKRFFSDPEDQALADMCDPQGVGSRRERAGEPETQIAEDTPK